MKHYVIIDHIEEDQFYDIAIVRVGRMEDDGVLLDIPIPKGINDAWVDHIITYEINKLIDYIEDTDGKTTQETKKENG